MAWHKVPAMSFWFFVVVIGFFGCGGGGVF
jgi:hypothetical protein